MSEDDEILWLKPTVEQLKAQFLALLEELEETPMELAKRMHSLGDHRSPSAILRSIQRASSGESGVSGELLVILKMLAKQQRQRIKKYSNIQWQRFSNDTISAVVDEFTISLYPQNRARWLVSVVHQGGYSHCWPVWQKNLAAAKLKALTTLDDAKDAIEEAEAERLQLSRAG